MRVKREDQQQSLVIHRTRQGFIETRTAITKAGDAYLRSLLVMGERAVLAAAKSKSDPLSLWALELEKRRGY